MFMVETGVDPWVFFLFQYEEGLFQRKRNFNTTIEERKKGKTGPGFWIKEEKGREWAPRSTGIRPSLQNELMENLCRRSISKC
jgi:hypothetical protein